MDLLYDTLFNGLAIGSVLVLAALGLAVVFGLMGVINMAHGELMMIGAYTTFVVQNLFKSGPLEALFPAYILLAIPAAFLVSGLFGLLLEVSTTHRVELCREIFSGVDSQALSGTPGDLCARCASHQAATDPF